MQRSRFKRVLQGKSDAGEIAAFHCVLFQAFDVFIVSFLLALHFVMLIDVDRYNIEDGIKCRGNSQGKQNYYPDMAFLIMSCRIVSWTNFHP